MKGVITDSRLELPFTFQVKVFVDPPHFTMPLKDQYIQLYSSFNYTLPNFVSQLPTQIRLLSDFRFCKLYYSPLMIVFTASNPKDVGVHDIRIELNDMYSMPAIYQFKLSIVGIKKPIDSKIKSSNVNKTIQSRNNSSLSAKIKSISPYGQIVVQFSENIEPLNITNLTLAFNK